MLAGILEANDLHGGTLVEPFAGGAGASLQLLFDEYVSALVINDADQHIFALWTAMVDNTDEFVARVLSAPVSLRTWRESRAIYDDPSVGSLMDVGFATFFLNRCNRSGIIHSGGPIGGPEQSGKWKIDARYNPERLAGRIERIATYADWISVSCYDALELLEHHLPDERRLLVYLDPPYYEKGQRLYLNQMSPDDHQRLADYLSSAPPFNWVLTYDHAPEILHMYRAFDVRPFDLRYSAHGTRLGKEILVVDPRLRVSDELLESVSRPSKLRFSAPLTPSPPPSP